MDFKQGSAALALGSIFGFALDRGLVDVPAVIRSQFDFSSFIMLRMFLAASATSTAIISALDYFGIKSRSPKPCVAITDQDKSSLGGTIIGGLSLGAGMALSGSCPGTIWAQLGSRPDMTRLMVIFGAIVGTLSFVMINDSKDASGKSYLQKFDISLSNVSKSTRMTMSYMFITVATSIIFLIDAFFPWKKEIEAFTVSTNSGMISPAWDPAVAGILIGSLQLPWNLLLNASLGTSSAWVYITNALFCRPLSIFNDSQTLTDSCKSVKAQFQVLSSLGAILGAFTSHYLASMNGSPRFISNADAELSYTANFMGGILLLFGSRLASGCTSGHGLSGMSHLGLSSLVATIAMFSGAIVTTFLTSRL